MPLNKETKQNHYIGILDKRMIKVKLQCLKLINCVQTNDYYQKRIIIV